jgi:hypothetical protein
VADLKQDHQYVSHKYEPIDTFCLALSTWNGRNLRGQFKPLPAPRRACIDIITASSLASRALIPSRSLSFSPASASGQRQP